MQNAIVRAKISTNLLDVIFPNSKIPKTKLPRIKANDTKIFMKFFIVVPLNWLLLDWLLFAIRLSGRAQVFQLKRCGYLAVNDDCQNGKANDGSKVKQSFPTHCLHPFWWFYKRYFPFACHYYSIDFLKCKSLLENYFSPLSIISNVGRNIHVRTRTIFHRP